MFRTSDIVFITVMVAAAAFTYKTKHDAEGIMREARRLETQIRYQEDSIKVLNAEWSLLIQPARLQAMTDHFQSQLQLQPHDPRQIVNLSDVPEQSLAIEDLISAAHPKDKAKSDQIKTGSTRP